MRGMALAGRNTLSSVDSTVSFEKVLSVVFSSERVEQGAAGLAQASRRPSTRLAY